MLTEEANAKRRQYNANYREKHREELKAYKREWSKRNSDKVKEDQRNDWNRKAKEGRE